jgi:hypothetical protein
MTTESKTKKGAANKGDSKRGAAPFPFPFPLPLRHVLVCREKKFAAADENFIRALRPSVETQTHKSLVVSLDLVSTMAQSILSRSSCMREMPPRLREMVKNEVKSSIQLIPVEFNDFEDYAMDAKRAITNQDVSDLIKCATMAQFKDWKYNIGMPSVRVPVFDKIPRLFDKTGMGDAVVRHILKFLSPDDLLVCVAPINSNWLDFIWTRFPFLIQTLVLRWDSDMMMKRTRFLIKLLSPAFPKESKVVYFFAISSSCL